MWSSSCATCLPSSADSPSLRTTSSSTNRTEVLNLIEVNSGPPNQEHFPQLQDDAANRQDIAECFRKSPRVLTGISCIHRFFRATLVRSLIGDELARTVRKLADLETTAGNREEGIGLLQNLAWSSRPAISLSFESRRVPAPEP